MKIKIKCPKCKGTGISCLPDGLQETFDQFKIGLKMSAEALKARFPENEANITAFNNRLESLRKLGLLARTRSGKTWYYFRF